MLFLHKWKCKPIITSALGLRYLSADAGPKDFLTSLHNTSGGFMSAKRLGILGKCICGLCFMMLAASEDICTYAGLLANRKRSFKSLQNIKD